MRVLVPRGERAPITSSMLVESHHSKGDSDDAEGIGDQNPIAEFLDQIEKMQRQNDQFNGTVGSADLLSNFDGDDNDLLRKFVSEMDVTRPVNDILDLMILDLQKQLHKFTVIQQQQYRQKLLEKEEREMQMQAQIAQEAAAKEAERIRTQSENVETEIVSSDNLPPLCVSNRPNSLDRLESMQARSRQCNQKRTITRSNDKVAVDTEQTRQSKKLSRPPGQTDRVDRSEGSLRKKKQVRANIRVERSDVAAEKDPADRRKSTTYSCAECDKEFNFKWLLIRHLRIHSGEKPFKCGECGSSFSQKISLTVHKRIHTGEKPFKCGECGSSFCHKFTLTAHKRIHTGAKPFECRICNVAFSQKPILSRHLLIHTNEKPFSCDICKQSFRLKGVLSDHMNIHSGNRPHKCNVCQKTFRQRQSLSEHRKVHAAPRKKSSRPISNF